MYGPAHRGAACPLSSPKGTHVKWVKRIVIGLVVVFAFFYLITRPEDAATAVEGAVGAVWTGVEAVGTFFTKLAT